MYHYHLNEEVRTGRTIAFAARICLELGLHRRISVEKAFPDTASRTEALRAFWAVYMLERRLSLGQGIPFMIQDSFLDPSLLTIDHSSKLLPTLLEWTRLAGKTWYALNSYSDTSFENTLENVNYLDYQILQWYNSLPECWRLSDGTSRPSGDEQTRYYQSVLFVRKSHLRCLIYRPIFQSSTNVRQNEQMFWAGINITKDTIRTLVRLNDTTALVRTHPLFFQQLLLTAFGNLLLAIVNARAEAWDSVRAEFDMVLTLFRYLASNCTALRRTWQRLQGLRDLHAKLAQPQRATEATETWASSAQGSGIAALSFEDIFPKFPSLTEHTQSSASLAATAQAIGSTRNGDDGSAEGLPGDLGNNNTGLENFFDFPFLNLEALEAEMLV